MNGKWYYAKDGGKFGPFDFEQFRQMAAAGMLQPTDMVSSDEGRTWGSAGTVTGLFPGEPPSIEVSPTPAHTNAAHTPRTGRIRRSAFWVVSTHVLTTGFALPTVASVLGWAVLNATALAPLQGFLVFLAFQALGYIGGTYYSLSYIRKVALIERPLACVTPSVITFVILAVAGFAANLWALARQAQDISLNEQAAAVAGLAAFYAVITFAFARVTRQGFATMRSSGPRVPASPPPERLPSATATAKPRAAVPLAFADRWGAWTEYLWCGWLYAMAVAIIFFCVHLWSGLVYTRAIWLISATTILLIVPLTSSLVWLVLDLFGPLAPRQERDMPEDAAVRQ